MKELPQVIYEDDTLIAFDKPAGLLTAPDRWDVDAENLMDMIHERLSPAYFNAHRLDREASGVLLCAKNMEVLKSVCRLFELRDISKEYLAIVHGVPAKKKDTIALAIAADPARTGLMKTVSARKGRPCETAYEVVEEFRGYAVLKVSPLTGRQHQIRVHLSAIKCPLVGDTVYGGKPLLLSKLKPGYKFKEDRAEIPLMKRVALHSAKLAFKHPVSGKEVIIVAEQPKDFVVAIRYLGRWVQ